MRLSQQRPASRSSSGSLSSSRSSYAASSSNVRLQTRQQRRQRHLLRRAAVAQSGLTTEAPPSTPVLPRGPGGRGPASDSSAPLSPSKVLFTDIELPLYDPTEQKVFDVVVVGSGPSGLAVADRIAQAGLEVLIVDPNPRAPWMNNFGVWIDEFEMMGLEDCLDVTWDRALVHLDSTKEGARYLSRPYGRVDRPKLKRRLLERCIASGVRFYQAKAQDVKHGGGRSTVQCDGGVQVSGSLLLDATGHSRKLVEFDKPFNPGYQGAYGIVVEVESHPFDLGTMLFMDWRDDHLDPYPDIKQRNAELPTFLYAMPFTPTKVFLEETSLVARPIIPFPELKLRLEKRMQHLGLKVLSVEEEEFCAIPMGGCLPARPQRVIGVGGTAGMVHPSTGYMVSRVMGAAPLVADAIIDQLSSVSDRATDSHLGRAPRSEAEADAMAAAVWAAMWPVQRLRQREFFEFGMEVLLKLDLAETREFFAAFFSLSPYHWHGFLSSRLGFLSLIGFGLSLFAKSSNAARVNLLQKGLPGLIVMLSRLATLKFTGSVLQSPSYADPRGIMAPADGLIYGNLQTMGERGRERTGFPSLGLEDRRTTQQQLADASPAVWAWPPTAAPPRRSSLQLAPAQTWPPAPAQAAPRQHSAPSPQSGVAGWLEGWRRLAEEQGCAVAEPSTSTLSTFSAPLPGATAATAPAQRSHSAPLPPQWEQQELGDLAALDLLPLGNLPAMAAPPQHRQFASPFQLGSLACSADRALARMQQQQQQHPPSGCSEDSGASPHSSTARVSGVEEDQRSCRSAPSCSIQMQDHHQQQQRQQQGPLPGGGAGFASPPPARRGGIDGSRPAPLLDASAGPSALSSLSWTDACSPVFSPSAATTTRGCGGGGSKRKSDELLYDCGAGGPASQTASFEQRCTKRASPQQSSRAAPPPTAVASLSSFFTSGPAASSAAAAAAPADLSHYPHPAPGPYASAPATAAALMARAAYHRREAAVLSQYMDALAAADLLGADMDADMEAAELAFGDADLAAAAQAALAGCPLAQQRQAPVPAGVTPSCLLPPGCSLLDGPF